ncbi:MAG TPA: deoxyuridine 5'-triphosphate nucleotidohydrolase [Dissulfurispiraceae bacterium]
MVEIRWSRIKDSAQIPSFAHKGDAGFDLAAAEDAVIYPFQKRLVSTGLKAEIPEGYELQVRPRSGLSLKTPLFIANSPGTIDSNYRGEIGIIVYHGPTLEYRGIRSFLLSFLKAIRTPLVIKTGDRIAQGVISKVPGLVFSDVAEDKLAPTTRGTGGFGSTGIKG